MKLVRLYSNLDHYFTPVDFNPGFNAVVAEIRHPENRKKSSHNLGKSTLARVVDFCLLGKVDKNHFFKKRDDLFSEFVFFLEVLLLDGNFLTIRRAVSAPSKISFKKSDIDEPDLTSLADEEWTHANLPFENAQGLLDGYLDFADISPWKYREALGYFLRRQSDYDDVFKLQRHMGPDIFWKPVLARVLGLDAELFRERYSLHNDIEQKQAELIAFEGRSGASDEQLENADALLQLREAEAERIQSEIDQFDFEDADSVTTDRLVEGIDQKIAELNERRYALSYSVRQIQDALQEDRITFDPAKAKKLFEEAGALFPDQIKTDFEQLIAFNRSITEERSQYLKNELKEINSELADIHDELSTLNTERKSALDFLRSEDVFEKYKEVSAKISKLHSEIEILRKQQEYRTNIQEKRENLRSLKSKYSTQQGVAERHVRSVSRDVGSLLAETRMHFSSIIERVLGRKALLNVFVNSEGNLDFRADFVDANELSTSEGDGTSYRKLMCVAFDLAVLRAHLGGKFPRFVYHDGIFEALDPRPKKNLLDIIREYSDLGIQTVITLIGSDAPPPEPDETEVLEAREIIVKLHDDGKDGRLFKFESW
tara:strand:- start:226 stop:2022 length:1797 start_codon:yes stop_codon:yes gene_type:complete